MGLDLRYLARKNEKTGEVFSLRAVPLGGFCAFEGEDSVDEEEKTEDKKDIFDEDKPIDVVEVKDKTDAGKEGVFNNKPPWQRLIVLLSGGIANLLSAFIFAFIFILVVGFATPSVTAVAINPDNGVAYNNELMVGDRIVAVNGTRVSVMNSYSELVANSGTDVTFSVIRNGQNVTINVKKQTIKEFDESKQEYVEYENKFGFTARYDYQTDVGVAFSEFVPYTFELAGMVLKSLFDMIAGKVAITDMTGTVGTVAFMAEAGATNWRNIFLLLPLLASNLGIFNLLPIPALDGSKCVFTIIEWIRKKPINRKVENYIHAIGLILLLGFVIIVDVLHFVL